MEQKKRGMGITWNQQSLRWFHTAGEYTGYNRKIAELLLAYLPDDASVCDIGCGAGLVDLELARKVKHVTCVDIDPVVVESVRADAQKQGIFNLTSVCMDGKALDGCWDAVITMFHGGIESYLDYSRLARRVFLMITHGMTSERFGPENRRPERCHGTEHTKQSLDELGISYQLLETQLEHGQPFTDWSDARKFVKAYSMPMEDEELEQYLREHLVETGEEAYPYYLPKTKKIGLFIIRKDGEA